MCSGISSHKLSPLSTVTALLFLWGCCDSNYRDFPVIFGTRVPFSMLNIQVVRAPEALVPLWCKISDLNLYNPTPKVVSVGFTGMCLPRINHSNFGRVLTIHLVSVEHSTSIHAVLFTDVRRAIAAPPLACIVVSLSVSVFLCVVCA